MILGDLIENLQQLAEEYGREIDIEIDADPDNPNSALYTKVHSVVGDCIIFAMKNSMKKSEIRLNLLGSHTSNIV